jgi:hypothetical protein
LTAVRATAPEAIYSADRYRFVWDDAKVQVDLEGLHDSRDGLTGEIEIDVTDGPTRGHLHHARFNLSSTQARTTLAKALAPRRSDCDWQGMLEQVCHLALTRHREGDPMIDLRTVDTSARPRFVLDPFLEAGGPTILFADGGSGKTTLAKAMAVSLSTGLPILGATPHRVHKVAILDWETDAEAHAVGLRAICAGIGIEPPVMYYQRMAASLAESALVLRRKFADLGISYVIIDSLGAARGGEPESADTTIRLFSAARTLGVPWLGIDHVTKSGTDKTRPFGSTYTHNLARLTWSAEKVQGEDSPRLTVSLTNHKANNGRPARRRGFHIDFVEDHGQPTSITFTACNVRDVVATTGKPSQRDQVYAVLKANNGGMLLRDIQGALEAEGIVLTDTVLRAVLNRHKTLFVSVGGTGTATKWGLLAHASA